MSRPKLKTKRDMKPRRNRRGFNTAGTKHNPGFGKFGVFLTAHRQVVQACAIFAVSLGLLLVLYNWLINNSSFNGFLHFNAQVTAAFLNITGRGVHVSNNVVSSAQFSFQIVDLCTAIMPMMIFTAAVAAFPSSLKQKLIGLLSGLAIIFVVNQIRLFSLFYIGIYVPNIMDTMHLFVWQSLMILLVIGIWLVWAYKYVQKANS